MSRFLQVLLIACIAVAVCSAEAPRARSVRTSAASRYQQQHRRRFSARQEAAPVDEAVTPYPTADELKPEVPFDEVPAVNDAPAVEEDIAAEEIVPEDTPVAESPNFVADEEHQPDAVYGPPEDEELPATEQQDEQTVAEDTQVFAEEEETVSAVAAEESQRLTARRAGRKSVRPSKLRSARPAKLVKKTTRKVQRSARLQQQPQVFAPQPLFYYTAQYQGW